MVKHIAVQMECNAFCTLEFSLNHRMVRKHLYFCACRAALANYPCPKCLVPKDKLHHVSKEFPARTSESMKAVIQEASMAPTKAKKEKILQDHGLHDIEVWLITSLHESLTDMETVVPALFMGLQVF